jgi:cold shock CspA family protein
MGFLVTPTDLDSLRRWGARVIVPQVCLRCFRQKGPLPKRRGTVKWFDSRKRHGVIVGEDGKEIRFRQDQLFGENGHQPREGQVVRFHMRSESRDPEALNVEMLD